MFSVLKLKVAQKFLIYLNLFFIVFLLLLFFLILQKFEKLVFENLNKQAESIFQQIIITRKWIADHGGIYVEKLPWVKPNPYLELVGEKSYILSKEGKILIKENPALVTRQLSEYSKKNLYYWFKITSLKYLNPLNKPDDTESEALQSFALKKATVYQKIEKIEGTFVYRYIKPLVTEESCLRCHEKQGYKIGDVRGAISIFIPVEDTLRRLASYKKIAITIFIFGFLTINSIIFFLSYRFIFYPLQCLIRLLKILRKLHYPKSSDEKAPLRPSPINEWQQIVKAINDFVKEINNYEDMLEEKIRQVTNELQQKNKILEDLIEKKSFLLCNMAHEIKTPLTSIKGSLEYLKFLLSQNETNLPLSLKERMDDFIQVAQRNSERLIKLLTALIEIERAETKLLELELIEFSPLELLQEVILMLENNLKEKNLSLKIEAPEDLIIKADYEKILTVVLNLLSNAIKHSPSHGTISMRVKEENGSVLFEIEDEGKGLKDLSPRIFEKFYKGTNQEGFGLGLTIAKAYVEAHQGIIGAKNGPKGAIFYFYLPKN